MLIPTIIFIVVLILLMTAFYYLSKSVYNSAQNDWKTVEYFEKKSHEVQTKKEIEKLHAEFLLKSKTITNNLCFQRLGIIDGYLRGLYQQFK